MDNHCPQCGHRILDDIVSTGEFEGLCESCALDKAFLSGKFNGFVIWPDLMKGDRVRGEDLPTAIEVALPYPQDIHKELDKHIIGQEHIKKIMSVAAINHMKKGKHGLTAVKSNILLLGPTGCGKTLFAQTLAEILDVPFAIADATSITEAGYVGGDVEDVVKTLYLNSGKSKRKTEKGIIFIDEIDKLRRPSREQGRDVAGEGVQQSLLKLLEGKTIDIGGKYKETEIDTSGILFILAGSFAGIEPIIERRIANKKSIGFGAKIDKDIFTQTQLLEKVIPADLETFGMIPELIGRTPIIGGLHSLTEAHLLSILTDPKDSIVTQFKSVFAIDNKELSFTQEALVAIAKESVDKKIGARGLRSIVEKVLSEEMYKIADNKKRKIVITDKKVIKILKKA